MDKICSFYNCNNKHKAKGYCGFHYRSEYIGKRKCTVNGCKNKQHSLGYCYTHYIKSRGIKCSIENCENPVHSHGICKNHYDINKRKTDPAYKEKQKYIVRKWHKNHPEYQKNYWIKNKDRMTEQRMKRHDEILAYLKKYHESHKTEQNKNSQDYYQKNKMLCLNYYSNEKIECKECKENEIAFMIIDHIKPRKEYGHTRKTSSSQLYRNLVHEGFPSGYQVLCYNCNMVKEQERRRKETKYEENLVAKRNLRYIRKLKVDVMTVYSKGKPNCSCCNYDNMDGLSIDHIIGRKQQGHTREFGSTQLHQYLKRERFPKEFQVLCINCNSAKGKLGQCPHKI